MTEKEKVACAECGAEVELEGGLLVWAKKNPDKFRCPECQKKKYANKIAEGKASNAKSFAKKSEASQYRSPDRRDGCANRTVSRHGISEGAYFGKREKTECLTLLG